MKIKPLQYIFSQSSHSDLSSDYEVFRRRVFMSILWVAAIFALLFGIMHDLKINLIDDIHAKVNYIYSAVCVAVFLLLKSDKKYFLPSISIFLIASHLTFTSALLNVPTDEFRAIWFYLLVLVAYMLDGAKTGMISVFAAIVTILGANYFTELQLSHVALNSIILGLVILGVIAHVFTNRATLYARLVEEKNIQLEKLAKEDPLTSIMNARSYYDIGQQLFKLARRENKALCTLYLDIDHFKNINDSYGHHCGDRVLISITQVIKSALRDSDILARIGGEEFCILLPDTSLEGGQVLAEKIRAAIENTPISLEKITIQVTTSIGVTAISDDDKDLDSIQMRADKNLYAAKRIGRNRVVAS